MATKQDQKTPTIESFAGRSYEAFIRGSRHFIPMREAIKARSQAGVPFQLGTRVRYPDKSVGTISVVEESLIKGIPLEEEKTAK